MKRALAQGTVVAVMLWLALSDFANSRLPEPTTPAPATAAPMLSDAPHEEETSAPKPPSAPVLTEHALRVGRGDTLISLLTGAGVAMSEAHEAIEALKKSKTYNPKQLRPGIDVTLSFLTSPEETNGAGQTEKPQKTFLGLRLPIRYDEDAVVRRNDEDRFVAEKAVKPLRSELVRTGAAIETSLFEAAVNADIPTPVVIELIRIYSFDVDFQRDIRSGDSFEMMFERFRDEDGRVVHNGVVLYAELVLGGKPYPIYRFSPEKEVTDYFNAKGESVRRALMRTPIDGARLSSGFGKRRHPILGYTRMHRGVDFAAPTGTPIFASGNGVVERANWYGGYGKYIRIRHNSRFKTAYAHLQSYANGLRKGVRVRQGQIIGYVGTTGRSTGPHLHYEVIEFDRQMNPMGLDLPTGLKLEGRFLAEFETKRADIDKQFAKLPLQTQLASNDDDK